MTIRITESEAEPNLGLGGSVTLAICFHTSYSLLLKLCPRHNLQKRSGCVSDRFSQNHWGERRSANSGASAGITTAGNVNTNCFHRKRQGKIQTEHSASPLGEIQLSNINRGASTDHKRKACDVEPDSWETEDPFICTTPKSTQWCQSSPKCSWQRLNARPRMTRVPSLSKSTHPAPESQSPDVHLGVLSIPMGRAWQTHTLGHELCCCDSSREAVLLGHQTPVPVSHNPSGGKKRHHAEDHWARAAAVLPAQLGWPASRRTEAAGHQFQLSSDAHPQITLWLPSSPAHTDLSGLREVTFFYYMAQFGTVRSLVFGVGLYCPRVILIFFVPFFFFKNRLPNQDIY